MENLEQKLQQAYEILENIQNNDAFTIEEAFFAIEEASGYIAEVLALMRGDN
jgi:hypothetical protein